MPSRHSTSTANRDIASWRSSAARTGADGMVLESGRSAEDRHDAVTGELIDGPAVSLHHRQRSDEHVRT